MTDRKAPKSQAERAREYRERHKSPLVDNSVTRDEFRDAFVTFRDEVRDEIVTLIDAKMSEIVTVLRDSSPSAAPLGSRLEGESPIPSRNEKSDASRNVTDDRHETRVWTNSFTARPGQIPYCEYCKHLLVNCQCDRPQPNLDHPRTFDPEAIRNCRLCDHNGFVIIDDGEPNNGVPTVAICTHRQSIESARSDLA